MWSCCRGEFSLLLFPTSKTHPIFFIFSLSPPSPSIHLFQGYTYSQISFTTSVLSRTWSFSLVFTRLRAHNLILENPKWKCSMWLFPMFLVSLKKFRLAPFCPLLAIFLILANQPAYHQLNGVLSGWELQWRDNGQQASYLCLDVWSIPPDEWSFRKTFSRYGIKLFSQHKKKKIRTDSKCSKCRPDFKRIYPFEKDKVYFDLYFFKKSTFGN